MKLTPFVATVIGGALLSAGAYAAGDPPTQQRKSQAGQDRSMSQPQGMQRTQQDQAQSSETVRKAQQALKDKGFDPGPVDGIMGPQTREAVKKFQDKQANMKGSGQLNQQTLSALGVEGGAGMGSTAGSQRGASAPPAAGGSPPPGAGGKQPESQKSR